MTFRENANLKNSQVRRGGSGGRRAGSGTVAAGSGLLGVVVTVIYILMGGNISDLSGGGGTTGASTNYNSEYVSAADSAGEDDFAECRTGADANANVDCRMVGTVISVQDYWERAFSDYEPAETVIFTGATSTGCGDATSAVGPFYCPIDSTIYLDTAFFEQLEQLGSDGGSLSQMYVVAHEYGHHIQNLTGVLSRYGGGSQGDGSNAVRVELQADCFAGAWVGNAATTQDIDGNTLLEPITQRQVESALSAAEAVGDDSIQSQSGSRINPDLWTHGSAAQREHWFTVGYESGNPNTCDTFSVSADQLDG